MHLSRVCLLPLCIVLSLPVAVYSEGTWSLCTFSLETRSSTNISNIYNLAVPHKSTDDIESLYVPLKYIDGIGLPITFEPYISFLQVICPGLDGLARVAESYAIQVAAPELYICYPNSFNGTSYDRRQCHLLPMVIANLSAFTDAQCDYVLCQLAWIAPFLASSIQSTWTIEVNSAGHFEGVVTQEIHRVTTATATLYPSLLSSLTTPISIKPAAVELQFIYEGTATKAFIVQDGLGDSVIVISDNNFATIKYLPVSVLNIPRTTQCQCENDASPDRYILALSKRWILVLNGNIYEVSLASFASGTGPFTTTILTSCVGIVRTSRQRYRHAYIISALGKCKDIDNLYFTRFDPQTDTLNFTVFASISQYENCIHLFPSAGVVCAVIDSVNTGAQKGLTFSLISVRFTNGTISYAVVLQRFDDIPTLPKLRAIIDFGPDVSRISVPDKVTSFIYLWGTKIYFSDTFGVTWEFLSELPSPLKLLVPYDNDVFFLTNENKLYFSMPTADTTRPIFPSTEWLVVNEISNLDLLPVDAEIVTFFVTAESDLIILYKSESTDNGQLTRFELPYLFINYLQNYRDRKRDELKSLPTDLTVGITYACPFKAFLGAFPTRRQFTHMNELTYSEPLLNSPHLLFDNTTSIIYMSIVENFRYTISTATTLTYAEYHTIVDKWRISLNQDQDFHNYLFANLNPFSHVLLDLAYYDMVVEAYGSAYFTMPELIYLDKVDTFTFSLYLTLSDKNYADVSYSTVSHDLSALSIAIHASEPDYLIVNSTKAVFPYNMTVKYDITIVTSEAYKKQFNVQTLPGQLLHSLSVYISAWMAPTSCLFYNGYSGQFLGVHILNVKLGCPPQQSITFDWMAANAKSSDPSVREVTADCYYPYPNMLCFYHGNTFWPFFLINDLSTLDVKTYTGKYTLSIVGGGPTREKVRMYSREEILKYSSQNGTALMMGAVNVLPATVAEDFPIFDLNNNGVQWFCQRGSDCDNILPQPPRTPEFFLILKFTNNGVAAGSTNCDFTFTFMVHLHGLPISSVRMATVLLAISLIGFSLYVFMYWRCKRNNGILADKFAAFVCRRRPEVVSDKLEEMGDTETSIPEAGDAGGSITPKPPKPAQITDEAVATSKPVKEKSQETPLQRIKDQKAPAVGRVEIINEATVRKQDTKTESVDKTPTSTELTELSDLSVSTVPTIGTPAELQSYDKMADNRISSAGRAQQQQQQVEGPSRIVRYNEPVPESTTTPLEFLPLGESVSVSRDDMDSLSQEGSSVDQVHLSTSDNQTRKESTKREPVIGSQSMPSTVEEAAKMDQYVTTKPEPVRTRQAPSEQRTIQEDHEDGTDLDFFLTAARQTTPPNTNVAALINPHIEPPAASIPLILTASSLVDVHRDPASAPTTSSGTGSSRGSSSTSPTTDVSRKY